MDKDLILQRLEDIAGPVLANLGYELVERELLQDGGRMVLRVYIDREGGVSIDDCERASRAIEDLIEVEEVVPFAYNLEVSSPGIMRPLRKRADFEKYAGHAVRLKTREPLEGRGNFKGTLNGIDNDDVLVSVDGKQYRVPLNLLAKARLEADIKFKKK